MSGSQTLDSVLEQLQRTLRITDGVTRFRIIKLRAGVGAPPDLRQEAPAEAEVVAEVEVAAEAVEAAVIEEAVEEAVAEEIVEEAIAEVAVEEAVAEAQAADDAAPAA